ncbi:MAG: AAA family ATPase, partial [Gammaproteobacteria bacterium]|nr:AAA family ATPase [Gammaproteobacteria bacterium]
MAIDFIRLVAEHRVVVCCGAGGVGKTTSAAALGMLAARQGRRVLVMTIDPAKRLAQAMGLHDLDNDPQPVAVDAPGALSAMMLDTKRTFDQMIETYAPSERVRDTIFENSYYQQLSSSLGGSRELIAMERVLEIISADDFDLLIVDTPPAQHALDFLDAPQRLIDLLDGSLTKLLIAPYGVAARAQFNFFRQSSAVALKFMERFTGVEMLADLSNFLLAFSSMFDGLKLRSEKVMALMNESTTSFLLICAPEPVSLGQVNQFTERLEREQIAIAGVLVNRVHPAVSEEPLTSDDIRLLDAVPCDP